MEGSRSSVDPESTEKISLPEEKSIRLVVITDSECLEGIQTLAAVLAGNDPGEQLRRPYLRGSLSNLLATLRRAYQNPGIPETTEEPVVSSPPAREEKKKSSPKGK